MAKQTVAKPKGDTRGPVGTAADLVLIDKHGKETVKPPGKPLVDFGPDKGD